MQNFVAGLFALGAVVAFFGGVLGLVSPSVFRVGRMKENPSRQRIAVISFAVIVVLFVGVGITAPKPTPEEMAKVEMAAAKARETEEAKVALAAKEAEAAAANKAEAVAKKTRESLSATIQAIRVADKMCADSILEVGSKAKAGGDRYDLYGVAKDAADNCAQSAEDMVKIEVSKDIEEARKLCIEGELTRAMALSKSASIFDAGQGSPAALHSLKEDMSAGQMKVLACMGVLVITARKAGIEIDDM